LQEAARLNGLRRTVCASSNYLIGINEQRRTIDPTAPVRRCGQAARRPGGFYGLSKAFCKNLAQLKNDR